MAIGADFMDDSFILQRNARINDYSRPHLKLLAMNAINADDRIITSGRAQAAGSLQKLYG